MHLMQEDDKGGFQMNGIKKLHIVLACMAASGIDKKLDVKSEMMGSAEDVPKLYEDAMAQEDAAKWYKAMADEKDCLDRYNVYDLVPKVPPGKKLVDRGWVHTMKHKHNSNGSIVKYQLCFVMRGYTPVYVIDYNKMYIPIAKISSILTILTITA